MISVNYGVFLAYLLNAPWATYGRILNHFFLGAIP
jgi:hypothetical protein